MSGLTAAESRAAESPPLPAATALPTTTTLHDAAELSRRSERLEWRNLKLLAAYQVVLRLSWIFKTESVIVPAFLHAISGSAWMQGWLPLLNRFGQSLPPLYFAERLRDMPRKKASLLRTTFGMGAVFVLLAAVLIAFPQPTAWWPALFLVFYAVFFVATGLNNLAFNTLQGKLLRAERRGQLMSRGGVLGSVAAVLAVWLVLGRWRAEELDSFLLPFFATGLGMIVASALGAAIAEPADDITRKRVQRSVTDRLFAPFREAWQVVKADRHFRRLVICGGLFITSQFLFPHYVPLAKNEMRSGAVHLLVFVIVQNVGVGLFSLLLGSLADRYGNRLTLRIALAFCAATPIIAVALAKGWIPGGQNHYWFTFFILGMQPVTFKTFTNYTLELTDPALHPRYLSTLTICLAVPVILSLPVGWAIGRYGAEPMFLTIAATIAAAWLMTFTMAEPRFWPKGERQEA